jgi:predicted permease
MRILFSKILAMFRRDVLDQDFDAEVETHLDMLIEQNISRGMAPGEAQQAALRSMGNVTRVKESQRESRGLPQIETVFADLKYAARMLRANPGFTLIAVLTLTLGVGVVTTVFTAYDAVALKPLPVADPSQVVRLERWIANGSRGDFQYGFSYPEYLYCRDRNDVFTSLVAASGSHTVVSGDGDRLGGQLVTANYFTDLGVPAQIGRTFLPEEDRTPGGNPVIVLSNAFWERRFHGDREVIGRIVKLNGVAFTIVGVAAKEFSGTAVIPQVPDFWAPVSMQAQLAPGRDWLNTPGDQQFQILARIKSGVGARRAEAETATLIRQFAGTYKEADRTTAVTLQRTSLLGNTEDVRFQASVLAIMLIVGMVLLVGCVNIANMLLARGAARQKEISVRLALGASRGRVIRQLLTESLLLSLIGGAGGLLFSVWTSKLLWIGLQQFLQRTSKGLGFDIAVGIDLSPDWRVLAYAMALSLFAGLLFGLSPALQFSRPDLTTALKTDGGFGGGWSRSRLRSLLVATQVTVSMVLLISAGLLMRGLSRAQVAEPGYETQSVYSVFGDFGADPVKAAALERRLMDRFQTLSEVRNIALGTVPLMGTWTADVMIGSERERSLAGYASDTYFELFGIPLVRGRHLTRLESEQGANLAVVSEAAARKFWPGEDPIGRVFKLDTNWHGSYANFEVIGVAKDVRFASLSRVDVARVYLAPKPGAWNAGLLVRTEGDSRRTVAAIRAAAGTIDPRLAAGLSTMNLEAGPVQLSRSFAEISALFAAILAALALVLAGVGIYGVMSYLVSRSVKEIGVRVALGARAGDVLFSVIVRGLRPVFCGLVLGVAGAAALSALLHSTLALPGSSDFFYGVPFYDPATFLGLSAFLIVVAAIASAIPARRALGVDPMVALRYE